MTAPYTAPYCSYLSEGFLSVIFEVFRVHVEVVLIDGEWLGALSDAGYKLLHLQEGAARPVAFEAPHRDVGGSDTICRQGTRGVTGLNLMIINRR